MLKFLSAVEAKVWAAAGGGSILSGFILWLIGYLAFGGSTDAAKAEATVQAVPAPVSLFIIALAAAVSGYMAPHTAKVETQTTTGSTPSPAEPVDPASDVLAAANAIYPSSTSAENVSAQV